MITASVPSKFAASAPAVRFAKTATLCYAPAYINHANVLRLVCAASHPHAAPRYFSTTSRTQLRDFFPRKETTHIQTTPPAWPHHGYTMEEMKAVVPAHRKPDGLVDWAAWKVVRMARFWMDVATGMQRSQQVDKKNPTTAIAAEKPLSEAQWVSDHSAELRQIVWTPANH